MSVIFCVHGADMILYFKKTWAAWPELNIFFFIFWVLFYLFFG